ncbi:MAG: hypothetical protein N3A69_12390 [Leptospiraceae bacterium]|nr:hypothetical protein [Leptospiraceae bacterium]
MDSPPKAKELSQKVNPKKLPPYSEVNQIKITRNEIKQEDDSPFWGLIGRVNFCLVIPCVEKKKLEMEVIYSFKERELKKETVKGHSYEIISLLLIPYSIFFRNEYNKTIWELFESKVEPYIRAKLAEVESKKTEILKNTEKAFNEISSHNPKKCKVIYDFKEEYSGLLTEEQERAIASQFDTCIENRVKSLIVENYPFLEPHINKQIYFHKYKPTRFYLFHLFYVLFLHKSEFLGLDSFTYDFFKESDAKFYLNMRISYDFVTIRFEVLKDRINCTSAETRIESNPNGWEFITSEFFNKLYQYPIEDTSWNWEIIDGE